MKRGIIVAGVGVLLLCAGLAAYRHAPPPPTAHFSLTFLHYTNDFRRIRPKMYKLPDDTDRSMAVFKLNILRSNFGINPYGQIELHLPDGWSPDVNYLRGSFIELQRPEAHSAYYVLTVPVPAGTNVWRYNVPCIDISPRPAWQQKAIKLLNQAGFNIRDPEYTITSPEITR